MPYSMKLQGKQKFKHADHIAWRRVEQESVILDLNTSDYYSLSETGALIWESLGAGHSVEHVKEIVCRQYDIEPSVLHKHMESLVEQLVQDGLLRALDS